MEARLAGESVAGFASVGDTIEIIDDPFQGLCCRVVAATRDRASILLEVLGKLQSVEFQSRCAARFKGERSRRRKLWTVNLY